jgi:hypothetical protein
MANNRPAGQNLGLRSCEAAGQPTRPFGANAEGPLCEKTGLDWI